MFINMSKILFFLTLTLGTTISIAANSWLGVWLGLEINMLSFIPLMTNLKNLNSSEAALMYFLVQALASSIILLSVIINMIYTNTSFFIMTSDIWVSSNSTMIILPLMLKLGVAPFHFWFPNVMENLSWNNSLIMMTWQKLAPMMALSYLKLNSVLFFFVILSAMVGAIGGLNQTSLRKLLAFSSINHMGWMIMSLMFNEYLWFMYFILYSYLNCSVVFIFKMCQIFYLSQMYSMFMNSYLMKMCILSSTLSLGGLPPFLGFIPKWLVIQSMLTVKMNFITLFLILMSLITLFYYLKISFAGFMINYSNFNWEVKNKFNLTLLWIMLMILFLSIFGLFILINSMMIIF